MSGDVFRARSQSVVQAPFMHVSLTQNSFRWGMRRKGGGIIEATPRTDIGLPGGFGASNVRFIVTSSSTGNGPSYSLIITGAIPGFDDHGQHSKYEINLIPGREVEIFQNGQEIVPRPKIAGLVLFALRITQTLPTDLWLVPRSENRLAALHKSWIIAATALINLERKFSGLAHTKERAKKSQKEPVIKSGRSKRR